MRSLHSLNHQMGCASTHQLHDSPSQHCGAPSSACIIFEKLYYSTAKIKLFEQQLAMPKRHAAASFQGCVGGRARGGAGQGSLGQGRRMDTKTFLLLSRCLYTLQKSGSTSLFLSWKKWRIPSKSSNFLPPANRDVASSHPHQHMWQSAPHLRHNIMLPVDRSGRPQTLGWQGSPCKVQGRREFATQA